MKPESRTKREERAAVLALGAERRGEGVFRAWKEMSGSAAELLRYK